MSKELAVHKPIEIEPADPARLISLALEKNADPTTLSKLMDLQERWEINRAKKAYIQSMTAFKQEAPAVLKKGDRVDFMTQKGRTAYSYANLGSIVQEITAILGKHDLSASWQTSQEGTNITVTCHITHSAGYRESVTLTGPSDDSGNKNRIQAIGSTVTYLQRYTLLAALGLATGEDDDGQGGKFQPTQTSIRPPQSRTASAPVDAKPQQTKGAPSGKAISEGQKKLIFARCKAAALSEDDIKRAFSVEHITDLQMEQMNDVLAFIENPGPTGKKECRQGPSSCDYSTYDNDMNPLCGDKPCDYKAK